MGSKLLLLIASLAPVYAATLTFEPDAFVGGTLPGNYGSRAAGTPNVVLTWSTALETAFCSGETSYGDLSNVAYGCLPPPGGGDPGPMPGPFTVTFTADPGFTVSVDQFDVAGVDIDRVIGAIQVGTQTLNLVTAPALGHNTLNFAEAGSTVTLTITAPDFFTAGMDNLVFSQSPGGGDPVIPEPGGMLLMISGLVGLALGSRLRHKY
jgi:hypothetical protein